MGMRFPTRFCPLPAREKRRDVRLPTLRRTERRTPSRARPMEGRNFSPKSPPNLKERRLEFNNKKYRLIGVPFYNNRDENAFRQALESVLSLRNGI